MKKLLLFSAISLSCFNYAAQAMISDCEKEIQKTLPKVPKELVLRMANENLEILPKVRIVCKSWNQVVQKDLWGPINNFFNGVYKDSYELNSWFSSRHGYKAMNAEGHSYTSNKEAFKAGFKKLILNLGDEARDNQVLLPTHKVIRYYLEKTAEIKPPPSAIKVAQKRYPHLFTPVTPPNQLLLFSYLKLFQLHEDINNLRYFTAIHNSFELLSEFIHDKNKDVCLYTRTFREDDPYHYSLCDFEKWAPSSNFAPLHGQMLRLYKLALIDKDFTSDFFQAPPSLSAAQALQKIPVNLSSVSQDCKELREEVEKQILDFADKRFQILEEMKLYLTLFIYWLIEACSLNLKEGEAIQSHKKLDCFS